jgi:uncharacterized YccA/Bax inhibitor family protein
VLSRLEETTVADRHAPQRWPSAYSPDSDVDPRTGRPGPHAPGAGQAPGYGPVAYGRSPVTDVGAPERAMTLDDVVVRTLALLALVVVSAAFSWIAIHNNAVAGLFMVGSSIAGLALVLVISFKRITNPLPIAVYAILQGVLLGVVSREFERAFPGIVVQAVAGTLAVFFGMAALYKARVIRATPRLARWVMGALIGVVGLSLVNWMLSLFGHNLGIQYYGPTDRGGTLAIVFSLICIGVGALTFILDFDLIEQGVARGMPHRFAWYCAFGLIVGLIYLYWQILRLLGYLRN